MCTSLEKSLLRYAGWHGNCQSEYKDFMEKKGIKVYYQSACITLADVSWILPLFNFQIFVDIFTKVGTKKIMLKHG